MRVLFPSSETTVTTTSGSTPGDWGAGRLVGGSDLVLVTAECECECECSRLELLRLLLLDMGPGLGVKSCGESDFGKGVLLLSGDGALGS